MYIYIYICIYIYIGLTLSHLTLVHPLLCRRWTHWPNESRDFLEIHGLRHLLTEAENQLGEAKEDMTDRFPV